jgi:hypothetical protein
MRTSALAAGLELQPGTSPPVLQPYAGAKPPAKPNVGTLRRLVGAYLSLLGPATLADAARYLEARRVDVEQALPKDLVEVSVDGRTCVLPASQRSLLENPPEPDLVRLLGAFDPFLQARDRNLLVPDESLHKKLWPVLGRPGVLLAEGEVAGTWRPKSSGTKLTLAVEPFAKLPAAVWEDVEAEAERVAAARGYDKVAVTRAG